MDTRSHLKQIALTRFARHGYEGVSLAQIATDAGIKKPSIYNHFESKAALFLELADDAENTLLALVTESLASQRQAPFEQRLRHLVECCCTISYREHQGVFYKRFLLFPPRSSAARRATSAPVPSSVSTSVWARSSTPARRMPPSTRRWTRRPS
ncbi:TetR/AcrR family transcriptional regulator [Salinicola sp. JS01]|uniref:TetR/AcrR family transcriptional regulator n=1 Tax=Salinicola sp. JS01 TaxID=3050071 RepID=UPI00255B9F80|nr:TetR/AcrR family transcriptional regulator [Salinicola sp. JS01]WIX32961.1 TetR/AcrR family transcriptional regulator [Salinicola sp. JS01]